MLRVWVEGLCQSFCHMSMNISYACVNQIYSNMFIMKTSVFIICLGLLQSLRFSYV